MLSVGNAGAGVVWVNVQMDEGSLPADSDMDCRSRDVAFRYDGITMHHLLLTLPPLPSLKSREDLLLLLESPLLLVLTSRLLGTLCRIVIVALVQFLLGT